MPELNVDVTPSESPLPKWFTKVTLITEDVGKVTIKVVVPKIPTGQTPPSGISTTSPEATETVTLVCYFP